MSDPLERVNYIFESQGDAAGAWKVTRLAGRESMADLYEYAVDLCNEDLAANADVLLGTSSTVTIIRGARERHIHGIVRRVEHTGTRGLRSTARIVLVPALWAATKRVDSRIFQRKTTDVILREVLNGVLGTYGRSLRIELDRTPAEREYCVQYRESDLDFVRRLTEEEGIYWYFDHSGEKEELVLVDALTSLPEAPALEGAIAIAGPEADLMGAESIRHFEPNRALQTTSVVVRDFDWTHPSLDMTRESRGTDVQGIDRESYDYPAGLTIGPYDLGARQYMGDDGNDRARIRREARKSRESDYDGEANVVGFTAGTTFNLTGHGDDTLDTKYALTMVEIRGEQPEHFYDDSHDASTTVAVNERYRNTFTAVRTDVPWRARQNTPRPRIAGSQTATVVGPAGEEIYTDEHGRIKVQFHWDRQGQRNEQSSCFMRVSQAWAGPGWGFVFLPRIGMEVLVTFLEGDPDRPLVTGCVYNGQNTPPYPLPDEKTKSTIKTNSSPGHGGYNELRFEDLAGSEEIFLHAQKDFNEVVEHNHSTTVHVNQTNTVDCNQTESIGGNQSLSVTGNRTKTVEQKETNTINNERHTTVKPLDKLTVNGTRETIVNGTHTHTVNAGNGGAGAQTVTISNNRTVKVGVNDVLGVTANKTDTIGGVYTINGGPKIVAHQGGTTLTFEGGHVELAAAAYIQMSHGSGTVKIEDSGKIGIGSGTQIELKCGGATITITPSSITLQASEILLSAGGAVKVDGGGVGITGTKIMSTAGALNMITGAMVKIN